MSRQDGWNSIGDIRALEELSKRIRKEQDMRKWGELTLKLIEELRYLNGCVVRGRGRDIDPDKPFRNIFEYIKELEDC